MCGRFLERTGPSLKRDVTPANASSLPLLHPSPTLRTSLASSLSYFTYLFISCLAVQLFAQQCYATLAGFRGGRVHIALILSRRRLGCCNGFDSKAPRPCSALPKPLWESAELLRSCPSLVSFTLLLSTLFISIPPFATLPG